MKYLLTFCLLFIFQITASQNKTDDQIVRSFFEFREYEKADVYLTKLFEVDHEKYYPMALKTKMELKKFDEAIGIIKVMQRKDKINVEYNYQLGAIYLKVKDSHQGYKEWNQAIGNAIKHSEQVNKLATLFKTNKNWNFLETLIIQIKDARNEVYYQDMLIDAYLARGKFSEAIDLIMESVIKDESNYMNTMLRMQNFADDPSVMRIVQKKVYAKYAQNQNSEKWNQIAMWLAQATKDYEEALSIAKAFDKRTNGNGSYVLAISDVAYHDDMYLIALNGYQYLSKILTNNELVKLSREKEIETYYAILRSEVVLDSASLKSIHRCFTEYFNLYGMNYSTANIQILYSEITVKYSHDFEKAIHILEKLSEDPNVAMHLKSKAMIHLADYKLINNDIWEASLIYGKVDKNEKDSPLGEEARYKNSKIFYYNGDFELAIELLSILKSSTTELLANDALYLSVFIQENLNNDSFQNAMKLIAQAELFFYQNKSREALLILKDIESKFPNSKLIDDILIIEAEEANRTKNYAQAISIYSRVIEQFPTSILADKALYSWCILQETILKNTGKAMDGYLVLLTKYKDSVYVTDARKRLRKLRGEKEIES